MKRVLVLGGVAIALLAACSGTPGLTPAVLPGGSVSATFVVVVPGSSARAATRRTAPRYISPSTQSVVVSLAGKAMLDMNVAPASRRCIAGASASRTCSERARVAPGKQTFAVAAYDGVGGHGNVLASGTLTVDVTGGGQRIGIALSGRPAGVMVTVRSAYPSAGRASTQIVTVAEIDADGNTILGRYAAPVALTDDDRSGATKLSQSAADSSSSRVTLTYNGAPLSQARIEGRLPGGIAGAAVFAPSPALVAQYVAPQLITRNGPLPVGVSDLCIGPDGNVWATGASSGAIEKVEPDGKYTTYPLLGSEPLGISVGSDGDLWFAEQQAGKIGKITTAGVITSYAVPAPNGTTSQPSWTTLGPDGRTWFVDQGIGTTGFGEVTQRGTVVKYALPAKSGPTEIVAGPDGNLWITDGGLNAVDVVSTAGKIVAIHRLPTPDAGPWGIAVGPDKNLWIAEFGADRIARMTVTGKVKEFAVPTAFAGPLNVAAGPDGNVWFTETGGGFWDFVGKVGYITPDGKTIRDFPSGGVMAHVHDLAFDTKGNLWFTKFDLAFSALSKFVY